MSKNFRAAVITLSDKGAKGERVDESGAFLQQYLKEEGYDLVFYTMIPDEKEQLKDLLIQLCDENRCELIVTTGGTGFSNRDVTPEATKEVLEREVPGIAEAMRTYSMTITKRAMLSRAVSGIRKNTLIVNLPGSRKAVEESLTFISDTLIHGLEILVGTATDCARTTEDNYMQSNHLEKNIINHIDINKNHANVSLKQEKTIYAHLQDRLDRQKVARILISDISKKEGTLQELNKTIDVDSFAEEEKRRVLLEGKPIYVKKEEKVYFAEPFYPKERMLIFGGGHVAIPLIQFAKMVGFYIVVCDDRYEFANQERFTLADEVYSGPYETCMEQMKPSASDYCIIITRGHKQDKTCIEALFQYEEPIYTGLIGSKKRTSVVFEHLIELGLMKERIERIKTPIGLPIGAQTTEEIGISIMAEVILRKRLESKDSMVVNRSDLDWNALEILTTQQEPYAIVTIMAASGSVPRKAGAKMMVFADGTIKGTIGGGGVENTMIQKGIELISTKRYETVSVELNGADAMAEGMVCGGHLDILLEDAGI